MRDVETKLVYDDEKIIYEDDSSDADDASGCADCVDKKKHEFERTCSVLCVIVAFFVIAPVMLYAGSGSMNPLHWDLMHHHNVSYKFPVSVSVDDLSLSAIDARERDKVLEAVNLVVIAFGATVLASITSALVATYKPEMLPPDFQTKGTLSNVSQDISTPHGRMFTVSLFTAALLMLMSRYTYWLYRPWYPELDLATNPFMRNSLGPRAERRWRSAWANLPNVGFMFTAALPSLSDNSGFWCVLTMVHNVAAPLSMAFAVVMETVQLNYGENAFKSFFTEESATPYYGPLSNFQRLRVVVCLYTWVAGLVFLGLQVYFGIGDVLGVKIKKSYNLALMSFYGEVFGMCLAFSLPALSACEQWYWEDHKATPMLEAQGVISYISHLEQ
mmetsp:Transcript_11513/g.20375  ORF Transcript_11513/g.20375 Transcript_11513/m.20375 type:complete len:387 (+) Transcript_11513:71-1231(+)